MKARMLIATAVVALSGALATSASAEAAQKTPTKVTIKGSDGNFYGNVKSDDPSCAEGRKVTLFKLKGSQPNPKVDEKINSDTASLNGDKYTWDTGNTGEKNGKFYARVKKTDECGGDLSEVIRS